ncbi:unnamed protein product [Cuscuta campestris]|uniref:AIPP2-like SPOC-like domain-containing protein n=2 Tax=Cuscuta sect. Cleistogrammica TaxID=1824901 RepID=A0A484NIY3_9ASTE|nr:hypothetical protein DM860_005552 [Cuscuta australis]VFR00289.1 unnamed protein product [Cuscuta campestris]
MACSSEHKVDICLQCGDQGFANAFVYCVKCLEFAVHRYCLDIIPDTLDEFVIWICDKCMSKDPNKFIIQNSEANQDCSKRVKKKSDESIIAKEMQGACAKIDLTKTPHLARDSSVGKVNGGGKLDEQINQSCAKHVVGSTQDEQPSGGRPVSEIIWEGCFKICNKDYEIFDGLVAHLSIKACEKVYKEATLFPPMLKLEMLPKSAIWPNSFRNSGPTDENIALYFFPANPKCERGFEYLVEILMEEEFAMKTTLTNAELLVFTSKELPRQYWRFQGKYYLWGVFRGKQPSSKGPIKR